MICHRKHWYLTNLSVLKDYVLSVAVSPDGAWVVSGSKDRGVQFWNPKDAQTQLMLQGHKNSGKRSLEACHDQMLKFALF